MHNTKQSKYLQNNRFVSFCQWLLSAPQGLQFALRPASLPPLQSIDSLRCSECNQSKQRGGTGNGPVRRREESPRQSRLCRRWSPWRDVREELQEGCTEDSWRQRQPAHIPTFPIRQSIGRLPDQRIGSVCHCKRHLLTGWNRRFRNIHQCLGLERSDDRRTEFHSLSCNQRHDLDQPHVNHFPFYPKTETTKISKSFDLKNQNFDRKRPKFRQTLNLKNQNFDRKRPKFRQTLNWKTKISTLKNQNFNKFWPVKPKFRSWKTKNSTNFEL